MYEKHSDKSDGEGGSEKSDTDSESDGTGCVYEGEEAKQTEQENRYVGQIVFQSLNLYMYYLYRVKDLYDDDSKLPVYRWEKPHKHYTVEELTRILIINKLPQEKICSKQPMHVRHNVSFIVNLQSLDEPIDIRADENGVWKRKGSPVAFVSVHVHGKSTNFYKRSSLGKHPHHYKLSRTYYRHTCSPGL